MKKKTEYKIKFLMGIYVGSFITFILASMFIDFNDYNERLFTAIYTIIIGLWTLFLNYYFNNIKYRKK